MKWVALIICMNPDTGMVCGTRAVHAEFQDRAHCMRFVKTVQEYMDRPVYVTCVNPKEATYGSDL